MAEDLPGRPGRPPRHNILMAGVGLYDFDRWAPALARSDFEVDLVPTVASAKELLQQVPFGLILVRYPLLGEPIESFLDEIRRPDALSRQAPVVAMTEPDKLQEAQRLKEIGIQEIVPSGDTAVNIHEVICRLLNVAPRVSIRVVVRFDVRLESGTRLFVAQTENISATGMLVSTDRRYPRGTPVDFELTPPHDPSPIKGSAEVVRKTASDREKVNGLGLWFVAFRGDGERRLKEFVGRLAADQRKS